MQSYPIVLKNVYLDFSSLFEVDELSGRYYANFLIPKTDKAMVSHINNTVQKLKQAIVEAKQIPIHRIEANILADGEEMDDEIYHEFYILKSKTKMPDFARHSSDKTIYTKDPGYPIFSRGSLVNGLIDLQAYEYMSKHGVSKYLKGIQYKGPGLQFHSAQEVQVDWLDEEEPNF